LPPPLPIPPFAIEHLPKRAAASRAAKAPARRRLSQGAALHELETYFDNNQGRMDYPRYGALDLPVGSGQVEGQCKTLVGARCKQAGRRSWIYAGAEAILRLGAARQDRTFNAPWQRGRPLPA
jgi:hypothetical protein